MTTPAPATRPLVVAVDGSVSSMVALDWAASLAAAEKLPLVLLTAVVSPVPESEAWLAAHGIDHLRVRAQLKEQARALLRRCDARVHDQHAGLEIHHDLRGLAVVPRRAATKTWWRNIRSEPTPVAVLREGVWAPASARLITSDDPAHAPITAAYADRWPRAELPADQPVVLVQLGGPRPVR